MFTCVQIPHFSVAEILVKHCSLYNKPFLTERLLVGPDWFKCMLSGVLSSLHS